MLFFYLLFLGCFGTTLLQEERVSLTDLAKEEDRNVSTVWRWAQRGVRGVVLETFNVAGRRFTTREAFARFVEASTEAAQGSPVQSARANRQREAAISRAERECEDLGI